jgi:hypothetical protein
VYICSPPLDTCGDSLMIPLLVTATQQPLNLWQCTSSDGEVISICSGREFRTAHLQATTHSPSSFIFRCRNTSLLGTSRSSQTLSEKEGSSRKQSLTRGLLSAPWSGITLTRTPTYGSRCLSGPFARWAKTSARPERQNVRVWTGIRVPEGAKRPRSCGKASKLGIAGRYARNRPSSDMLLARSAPRTRLLRASDAVLAGLTSARPCR